MNRYFFDTYSFFEIIKGSKAYAVYMECGMITTIFQLAEFNYGLKRELDSKLADRLTESYRPCLVDVTLDDVKEAMTLRKVHKGMSIPDAVGYIVAKRFGVKFLTGDEDFRALPDVEFIK